MARTAAESSDSSMCWVMFGYASDETPALMPAPIYYAHKILKDLADARKAKM
jgi:S-adenosylmethionine synthetase